MPYLIARKYDAGTGDLVMNGATWANDRPLTAIVVRVLRTPVGSYLPDRNFGLDYSKLDKVTQNLGANFQAAVTQALSFLTKAGQLKSLKVSYATQGSVLLFTISFSDPSDPSAAPSIKGALVAGAVTQLELV